jgi:two-component system osmolarity sensor histidine kinase EnvZ
LVLLQVVTGVIFYDRHWATVSRHRAASLVGDISFLSQMLQWRNDAVSEENILRSAHSFLNLAVEILPSGPGIDGSFTPRGNLEKTLSQSLSGVFGDAYIIDTQSEPGRVTIWLQTNNNILKISTDNERLISSTTRIFVAWMVGTSIILFAVATLFMRNQVRPLRRLARAAENFGKGRTEAEFQPSGATEVRRAAAAFLAMRERIRRQIQQRTDMLAGVSHDLRTPLTRMKLQLAMLPKDDDATDMQNDVAEMETMISGYLDFVRGEGTEEQTVTNIGELLHEVARDAQINDTNILVSTDDEVTIPLRRNAFKRCLTNLVTNGLRHGSQNVEISSVLIDGQLEISIDDDGPGIPAEQREEVFRPFYRLDSSRNLDTGGTGLGLSIARDIVHGHGGDIELDESAMGGLKARIRLPL